MKKNEYMAPAVEACKVELRADLLSASVNLNNNAADDSEVFIKERASSDEWDGSGLW